MLLPHSRFIERKTHEELKKYEFCDSKEFGFESDR